MAELPTDSCIGDPLCSFVSCTASSASARSMTAAAYEAVVSEGRSGFRVAV